MSRRILYMSLFCIAAFLSIYGTADALSHFPAPTATESSCDFIGILKIDGVDAPPGDEVAFFDPQGVLCGAFIVAASGNYGIVHVYGDDQLTPGVDEGAVEGDVLTVRIWDASRGVEISGTDLKLVSGAPPPGSSFLPSPVLPVWQGQAGFVLNIDTTAHYGSPAPTPYVSDYAGRLAFGGTPADAGDEVAVFDPDGVLCGHARLVEAGRYGILHVYGDDPGTPVDEGAQPNDILAFKIWDRSAGLEYTAGNLVFSPGDPAGSTFMPAQVPPVWMMDVGYLLDIDVRSIPAASVFERWRRTLDSGSGNDTGLGVAMDSTGNTITAGYLSSSVVAENLSAHAVKYDPAGNELKNIHIETGPVNDPDPSYCDNGYKCGSSDLFRAVTVDEQDNVILAGTLSGTWYGYTLNSFHTGFWLQKYDANSNLLWEVVWEDGSASAWQDAFSVAVDPAGNIYVAGDTMHAWGDGTEHEWVILKYSPAGDLLLGPIYHNVSGFYYLPDRAQAIAVAPDGGFAAAGFIGVSGSLGSTTLNYDWHVRMYNANGSLRWADTFSGGASLNDVAAGAAFAPDGSLYVAGYTNKGTDNADLADYDWLVMKYDAASGARLWQHSYESAAGRSETGSAIAMDGSGNPVVAGYLRDAAGMVHPRLAWLDAATGDLLAEHVVEGTSNSYFSGIAIRDGVIALAGYVSNGTDNDMLTMLLDTDQTLDSDGDGLPDIVETGTGVYVGPEDTGTDPGNPDTDSDGMSDGWEVEKGLSPIDPADAGGDGDEDGLTNLEEYQHETDPGNPDTDSDGMFDGWEVEKGLNPIDPADAAGDGDEDSLTNLEEYQHGTDPGNPDTDGDTVPDGQEVAEGTDPLDPASNPLPDMPPPQIAPESHSFLRITTDGAPEPLFFDFEISEGLPFMDGGKHYRAELVGEQLAAPESVDVFEDETGVFRYRFETAGRPDGHYFIRVIDRKGKQAISRPILITTLFQSTVSSTWGDAGSACVLSVAGTESPWDGSSIAVPAEANTAGVNLFFSLVQSGAPFVSSGELLADVIHLEAQDSDGNPVVFGSPVTVTFFYGGIIGIVDPLDLAVVRYNEGAGRWERVTPLDNNLSAQTLRFQTTGFSLFGVVAPVEYRFSLVGGSSQGDFYMLSVPGQPLGINLRDHLESFLGVYDDTQWRLFAYDAATGGYVEAVGDHLVRFNEEFGLSPGRSFWLISRWDKENIFIPSLSFDKAAGSTFHTILTPGWNMVSQPWTAAVDLFSHDIQVSLDGNSWVRIDSAANGLTEGAFWRFLGREGSVGAWYERLVLAGSILAPDEPAPPPPGLEASALLPYRGYWLKNLADQPVYLRMIQGTATAAIRSEPPPERLRILAAQWMEKVFSGDRAAIAQSDGDRPPDPPEVSAGRRTLGVASGGGGGCFIRTIQEPVRHAGKGSGTVGLLFFSLLLTAMWRFFRSRGRF